MAITMAKLLRGKQKMKYDPNKIEKKWQKKWYNSGAFKAKNFSKKSKFYLLVEFPYPSGEGLHVGHCRPYIALDVIARKKRMQGFNVLFPMGWDAFGLPTENYAIKKKVHPSVVTKKNTDNFRRQMDLIGLSFDWSREINTTDPKYYKWTQWIFIKLFENGLAYKDKMAINWCSGCKIGLANEEVVNGRCERCGTKAEKKEKEQWLIKITKYAERLIEDLDLVDYPERVKVQQQDWIGRSEGALVKFPLEGVEDCIEVFTTRIDTIFSGTFIILAPGNKFIDRYKDKINNLKEVLEYRNYAKNVSDTERVKEERNVTGVELKGILARNPATGEEMPVWIAAFILEHYGTGAVFANAHDKRDFNLAKKYGLPLRTSVRPANEPLAHRVKNLEECFEGEGVLYNSMQFDGLTSVQARPKIISWLEEKGFAENKTSYKLRDWIFSRQHYWGEPIPMIFCDNCRRKSLENFKLQETNSNSKQIPNSHAYQQAGKFQIQDLTAGWTPVPEKNLPVELPKVKKYQPTNTGESPLSLIKNWVNVKCKKCKGPAKRETDTMPNWAGSNWYYLRYTDPKNNKKLAEGKNLKYWMPVDWYNGGMEHTTLHLLYSRFIFKFLWDIEAVPNSLGPEPYKKRTSHGIVLGPGGVKMSKSKDNVINPDDVIRQYGADTLRVYEMFMGPFRETIPWDPKGIIGCRRFLEKAYKLCINSSLKSKNAELKSKMQNNELVFLLNKTVKKVGEDIESMKFNTAVSSFMTFTNEWNLHPEELNKKDLAKFLVILSPFAPHLAEELWSRLQSNRGSSTKSGQSGFKGLCSQQKWPEYDEKLIKQDKILLIIQINGRVRDKIEVLAGTNQKEAEGIVFQRPKIKMWLEDKKVHPVKSAKGGAKQFNRVKKVIFVPDKLINIVL